ncbi:MAG TPA: HEAT repeat domain-containing protein [Polyangia bacterium]|jgi:HEAT repeat protein|nr:HEAT repeat domain-containing protein [Polyangia bacterium]
MRLLLTLAAVTLFSTTSFAGQPLTLAPTPDGGMDIRDGKAAVAHVAVKTAALRRGQARLREVVVEGHRVAELRVPVRGTPTEEVWVGEVGGKAAKTLWSGIAGPRDIDGETSLGVDVDAERVLEFQAAAGVTRCDGVPPRLFPRAYDFDSGRFRPVMSPLPEPGAEKLIARRGDPAMPTGRPLGGFHWIAASSTRASGSDARSLGAPVELNDGDVATTWAEGTGGDGRGEFVTARTTAGGYAIRGLRVFPGDGASLEAFRGKNRLRRFQIAFGPAREQRFDVEIPGDLAADAAHWRDPFWVPLPKPMPASCVTVIVTEVALGKEASPPKSFGTAAVGDLAVFTELDSPDGAERLVADLAGAPDCAARLPLLIGLGPAAVLPTAQAVLSAKGYARECLVEGLTTLEPAPKSPVVLEALAAAVAGATDKEERMVTAALAHASAAPVSPLAALLASEKAAVEDRARAARVLGALDDVRAAEVLVDALGRGPVAVRAAVVSAVAKAPKLPSSAVLAAIAAGPHDGGAREADLLRALPAVVKRDPDRRAEAVGSLRAALAPERSFEVRGRAVMALGTLGGAGDPGALAQLREHGDEPVLRYLATRELAALTPAAGASVDVRPALRGALADPDPRVRETAALALGQHGDKESASALIAGAKQEPWPFVRRAELEALGHLCTAGSGDLMLRAVARDVDEVRRAGLVGMVRCKDKRTRTVLFKVLANQNEAATVRELAAALIGESGDPSAAGLLATTLRSLVNEAEADLALEGVAATALRALARLGGPDAVGAAVTMAGDKRHPYRAAAIESLSTLCDPVAGRATLRALATGNEPSLAVAAQNAEKHCGWR